MNRTRIAVLAAAMAAGSVLMATPAQADPGTDLFTTALGAAGFGDIDPGTAVDVGQSVCPMLAEPGQQVADAAAHVADALGKPLGPATMFTGIAISLFCPAAVSSIANGQPPIPLNLLGF